jgi:hypothetical protein
MEKKKNRDKWLHVRLNTAEYDRIHNQFEKTTDGKISEYIRKIILGKPHIGSVRNQSTDDLVTELGKLRMELNAAGNNLNQAVKKLHALKDFKDIERWILSWELDKKGFYRSLESITVCLTKINSQWYQ